MANIARYSLPFVATSLSAALMGLADRIVIEHFLGLRAVGLYIGTHDLTFQIIGAATSVLVSRILPPARLLLRLRDCQRSLAVFF